MIHHEQVEAQEPKVVSIGSAIRASSDIKPMVRIIVEGKVGCGKTAILAMIKDLFEDKVEVIIENAYTSSELLFEEGNDHEKTLKMYSPVVVLSERLLTNS